MAMETQAIIGLKINLRKAGQEKRSPTNIKGDAKGKIMAVLNARAREVYNEHGITKYLKQPVLINDMYD